MTDPTTQLALLRAQRDATRDPALRAALDAAIAALEATAPPPPTAPPQPITNTAPNQGAQGIFYGNVYIHGQRGKSATELIGAYLQRQLLRCGRLPLQGVYQQKAADDTLAISLEQVYTQLATQHEIVREELTGAGLAGFDASAYLAAHRGDELLPGQERTRFIAHGAPARRPLGDALPEQSLTTLDADDLARLAQESERLQFLGPQLVTEAITTNQHLVLLGEPGSGKSTALRYLALILAQAGLDPSVDPAAQLEGWDALGDQGRLLPLFLPLLPFARRFADRADHPCDADDLWNYLAADLEANGRYAGVSTAVHDELLAGRVLLLLDGLDEVAGRASRQQVVGAVQAFARHYPQCRMVVTCRVRAYAGEHNAAWQLPGWPTATLADWTPGQMEHFVAAWYAAAATSGGMPTAKRDERTTALQAAIRRRGDLRRLGVRPLLLTIMALVHYNDGQLPEERVGLYSRCIDLLLGQWELAKEDGTGYGKLTDYIGLPDTDVATLRPLLQRAAFIAHAAGSADTPGSLGRDTLRLMVAETLEGRRHPQPLQGAEQFLDYTDVRAGLLQAGAAGEQYGFPHLTFQEYLAGLELVRGVQFVDRILERRTDDRWRVPIQLGVGHLVSEGTLAGPYQLFNRLLKMKDREEAQRRRDLLLIAELAEDVGWTRLIAGDELFEALRDELALALVSVVAGTTLPANDRVQAGVYLGDLGDPRPGVVTLPPAMVRIDGGEFIIGISPQEVDAFVAHVMRDYPEIDEEDVRTTIQSWSTTQPLILPTFELARYPVTNAQYKLFLDDNGYDPDMPWWDAAGRAWLRRDDQATVGLASYQQRTYKQHPEWWHDERLGIARPNHPVVGVSWYEAVAFCRRLSQHRGYNPDGYVYLLPSEAEWEYAARRATHRSYPWGDAEPDAERANFNQIYAGTTAVGCFPSGATPEDGIADLAGNVWEWTRSASRDYPYDPDDGREGMDNPAEKRFTLRGGGWNDRSITLRASYRNFPPPDFHVTTVGFRLARHLPAGTHAVS